MTYEDEYINVCGETLINCLKTLVTEDDRDVETLTTCLVINGTRLMQEHSNSFQELMDVVRLSLRNSLTSRRYRNHVLFIIDMHHAQFRYLSEDRETFYKRLLGEHTFFGFRRLVPSLAPFLMQGSNSGDTTEDLQFESGLSDTEGPVEHPQLPDLLSPPENGVVCYQNSLAENPAAGIVPNSLSGYGGQVCSCNPVYYTPIMESCVGQDQQLTYGSSYTAIPYSDAMGVFMDNDQRGQLYDSYPNNIPGNHLYPSLEGKSLPRFSSR
ncbi:hypothetical protein R5R35_013974 [Gryllus longicercus]|uniref:Uncharacterized protein n=1 Tax=Gryllus longicercus TaxID=2509291 RepID=A0AAN9Z3C1_9ORTH